MKVFFLLLVLSSCNFLYAQSKQESAPIPIAILPFVKPNGADVISLASVQETVTKEFVDRPRFTILDRSKFDAVIKELDIQKDAEFLNSKIIEQGKMIGAQYLITGVVSNMEIKKNTTQVPVDAKNLNKGYRTMTEYQGFINLSYQVIDVSTGASVYSENIPAYSRNYNSSNDGGIVANTLCHLSSGVEKAVMKQFPEDIHIVQVEEKSKKGLPETVLIDAGQSMFDESAGKKSACGDGAVNDALKSLFGSKKDQVRFGVYEVTMLTVKDKEVKRLVQIGELQLKEVQGDLSVCTVKDGASDILDKLNGNKQLLIRIK